MDTSAVDYDLPEQAIAQTPVEPRDSARLLIDEGPGRAPRHGHIPDLVELVGPGDVVVVNTTRVLPARLLVRRPSGGGAEVLLLEPLTPPDGEVARWEALVRPSRKLAPGTTLQVSDELIVVVADDLGEGRRIVELHVGGGRELLDVLEAVGHVPLPPYITAELRDPERYQTTYADQPGSVAAPTAGLHLTSELLDRIRATGAAVEPVELIVGLGTFRPIAAAKVEDHAMHAERYRVPASTMDRCAEATRVVAIGTTTVRALESAAATGELEGRTELFIHGDRPFAVVDALLTNFHQPRSSLLVLVDAFIGPRWRSLYDEALAEGYRFLSFGDALFLRGVRG
ncbi:MAG: tRNA preQ1(34) S-adenosylmethionine ribosyltransferase-isomerase QueA [Actinomycetota bacterium]|nr:tRNA preQ1(34) S-adenosylmethionine ribosyltransferase-isomerase QueA [Actinomycetota bacterium]